MALQHWRLGHNFTFLEFSCSSIVGDRPPFPGSKKKSQLRAVRNIWGWSRKQQQNENKNGVCSQLPPTTLSACAVYKELSQMEWWAGRDLSQSHQVCWCRFYFFSKNYLKNSRMKHLSRATPNYEQARVVTEVWREQRAGTLASSFLACPIKRKEIKKGVRQPSASENVVFKPLPAAAPWNLREMQNLWPANSETPSGSSNMFLTSPLGDSNIR